MDDVGLNKDEFYDVYRQFHSDATREEYELEWAEFQRLKADYERRKSLN